jgi:hypothetical protein
MKGTCTDHWVNNASLLAQRFWNNSMLFHSVSATLLSGCVFFISDYQDTDEPAVINGWKKVSLRLCDPFFIKPDLHRITFCLKLSHATCLQLELYCVNQAHNSLTIRPKKICGFPVSSYKNLGRVGRHFV